ncbi:4-coumarate--CoA ligase family protein [Brachybacterium endophyticum]|uniref:4-coumarate--CoA ligase family protein n=1 Tax=Brachybacterium endophyticum TaxID=2182385 RepID=A0A2U2RGT2_9MICO|nr:AMP-binding protein [Brachybacterium endophyticum]PWH05067.1 4-coumarate--CoA ligase family protein [Brachybacterium endophyticum]
MPFRSPYPDVEIPDVTLYDLLFTSLTEEDLERPLTIDGSSGAETSYAELRDQVNAIAGALAARGVGQGDVVALHSPNSPAFVATFHGILRAGGTATTVGAMATGKEIATQLEDSGARLLMTVSPLLDAVREAAALVGLADDKIIVLDGADAFESLTDLIAENRPAPEVSVDPSTDLAVLPYSSGTTGRPKGVMLTHRNLVANVAQAAELLGVRRDDNLLAVLPFYHIYGMTVLLNLAILKRASLVTMPRFDLPEFLRIIQDRRCNFVFIAPPIAVALAKHPLVDEFDLSVVSSVFSGGAPLDGEVGGAVARRLGCSVRQGYGMTEMSPVSQLIPAGRDDIPLASVGVTVPNMECMLQDPATREEIPVPESGVSAPGELCCKGPNVMPGYLNNPEATSLTIDDDGWLHTGDIGTVSAEGVVTLIDRLKELIKYKGYQVAPAELESTLLTHELIADAAVIAGYDTEGEEVPKAFVVLQEGAQLTEQEVMDFVAARVAPYKKVRQVVMIEAIPKSASGKILRKELRGA